MNIRSLFFLVFPLMLPVTLQAAEVRYIDSYPNQSDNIATVNNKGEFKSTSHSSYDLDELFKTVDSLQSNYNTFSRNGVDSSQKIKSDYEQQISSLSQRLDNIERENDQLKSQLRDLQNKVK